MLYRFIHSLIHYRSFPRHLIHVQWGRLLYIIGLTISFTFYYLIQTKDFMINPVFTLLPLCISCFLSIPLLSSRIHGLNQFVRKWHQQLQDEHHSRLLIWKANMLKAQVIGEMILYSTITLLSISFYEISFHIPLRFHFFFIIIINSYFIDSIPYFNFSYSFVSFPSSSFHHLHFSYSFLIYASCTLFLSYSHCSFENTGKSNMVKWIFQQQVVFMKDSHVSFSFY